jgi:hypothetical protein
MDRERLLSWVAIAMGIPRSELFLLRALRHFRLRPESFLPSAVFLLERMIAFAMLLYVEGAVQALFVRHIHRGNWLCRLDNKLMCARQSECQRQHAGCDDDKRPHVGILDHSTACAM